MNYPLYSDEYFMNEALKEAAKAFDKDEVPVGAVMVCENRIIARSHNMTEALTDATAHAEMLVITAAENFLGSRHLNDCTLFVTLEPCAMCASASQLVRLGRIVYGAGDPKMGYMLLGPGVLHPKTLIKRGVLENECGSLLTEFFRKKR
jgi:tRNA(adenine34) deaminase